MFLTEPSETPFDLRFWLFGTHVRVHPLFWLITAILGWDLTEGGGARGLYYLALWVACVFVSILLHEFGHIWMGRLFGSHGHIVLHSMGGLAVGSNALNRGWQRFLVSSAGPLIQFVLLGVVVLIQLALARSVDRFNLPDWYGPVMIALNMLVEINLFWPILNLFPIWPLDGGQMCREVCLAVSPRNGTYASLVISACTAGALALHCLYPKFLGHYVPLLYYFGDLYLALFFALFCVQSIMALMALNTARPRRYRDDDLPWER